MSFEQISTKADSIYERYRANFAGRSRISRDPSLLDGLVTELKSVIDEAGNVDEAQGEFISRAKEQLDVYTNEHAAIVDAQSGGDDAKRAHRLADWSSFLFQHYGRHFGGQSRRTRDSGLIASMAEDQKRWKNEFIAIRKSWDREWMNGTQERMESLTDLYGREGGEIDSARKSGSQGEQASALATVANNIFKSYRNHFQGQSRLSRRPALMRQIIDSLAATLAEMESLRDGEGVNAESHNKNIQIVTDRLKLYRSELEQIARTQSTQPYGDMLSKLAEDANALFAEYRSEFAGKQRSTRNEERLSTICDRLFHIGRFMGELDATRGDGRNDRNLQVVMDNLKMYERELQRIRDAKKAS